VILPEGGDLLLYLRRAGAPQWRLTQKTTN